MLIEPENKSGFRIGEIYAFISIDSDGDEGICAFPTGGVTMPMIAADETRLELLKEQAKILARMTNKEVRLIKLSTREDLETF